MEENYFATSRNGHELKDMYDPETNTFDLLTPSEFCGILEQIRETYDQQQTGE